MEPAPPSGDAVDAAAVLRWMRGHPQRLRALLAEQAGGDAEPPPAGDASVTAHLRLAAEGLAAVAPPALADPLARLAAGLDDWFEDHRPLLEHQMSLAPGAIALEAHLQFGAAPGSDPSLEAALERRVRLMAWSRLFLLAVEDHLGPSADGLADAALAWLGEHRRDLSRLIVTLDRAARAAVEERTGRAVTDPRVLDRTGQAAAVQAQVRLTVEALAAATKPGADAP